MKKEILEKIQILMQVSESSYITPDGNNYQATLINILNLLEEGFKSGELNGEDLIDINRELDKVFKYVSSIRTKAFANIKKGSILN